MKYAIIEKSGKQYKAFEGKTIEVDYFSANVGDQLELDRVLLIADGDRIDVGTPLVSEVKIKATVVAQIKGPKIIVFKYRPKQRYRSKTGHRQKYTRLQINSIEQSDKKKLKKGGSDGS